MITKDFNCRVISLRANRKIGELISKQNMSIRQTKNNLGINVSQNTKHRRKRECKNFV